MGLNSGASVLGEFVLGVGEYGMSEYRVGEYRVGECRVGECRNLYQVNVSLSLSLGECENSEFKK